MPRKNLIRSTTLPYHVTARGNNREVFPCEGVQAWNVLLDKCLEVRLLFEVEVHALVLMPNHFHLLVSTPLKYHDLGVVMQQLMRSVTRSMNSISGRSGHVFGGRYHWTLIDSTRYFRHAFKYVYRNPVRAGICGKVEDHPFSTLQGLIGKAHLPFPLYYPYGMSAIPGLSGNDHGLLHWLNEPFGSEEERAIRGALRKSVFTPPRSGWKRTGLLAEYPSERTQSDLDLCEPSFFDPEIERSAALPSGANL
jgi:REP element-mobilizing transposase RayT